MANHRHSVLLLEDEPHTREYLSAAIRSHPRLSLMASAGTCAEARKALETATPEVLLTDLQLPDGTGYDIIRLTRERHPDTQVMVITVLGDERSVLTAIEAGASGYLLKDGTAGEIGEAVLQLISGGSPISASIARHLLRRFQVAPTPVAATAQQTELGTRLSARETEVLRLVAKGFTYPEIAGLLELSAHTVTAHVRNIYKKLSVNSRGSAVYEAVAMGLIKLED